MRISVFITSYNQKDYLIEAIESVLNQTLRPFEIIIVDDCSTDGSQEMIERYAQAHPNLIRPFYHDRNQGIPKNKSFALKQVQGELVTYLDGDDRFLPRKLERELETFMDQPEAQIIYSNVYHINANGKRTSLWADGNILPPSGYVFREVFSRDFPRGQLFRNELVEYQSLREVGFYDNQFAMYHDWELRVRLTKNCKVAYCPEPLAEYRVHQGGISSSAAPRHLNEMKRIYFKHYSLLGDLPEADRFLVERKLSTTLAEFARRAAEGELERGNRRLAFKYWIDLLRFNRPKSLAPNLAAQIMLPRWAYLRLMGVYYKLQNGLNRFLGVES